MVKPLRHWKLILALVAIFLAGGLAGFVTGRVSTVKQAQNLLSRPETWAGRTLRRMDRDLQLSPEQRQQVAPLLRATARDLATTRRRAAAQNFQRIRAFYGELDPILNEEQRKKLEDAKLRIRRRMREAGENRRPHPRRPPFAPGRKPPGPSGPSGNGGSEKERLPES